MSKRINHNTTKILERIKFLEAEKAKLLPLRKEEIFRVLETNNGLTLDNKLLAGLAIYASNPENSNSNLLRELEELGRTKIPSIRNRVNARKASAAATIQSDAIKEKAIHG